MQDDTGKRNAADMFWSDELLISFQMKATLPK